MILDKDSTKSTILTIALDMFALRGYDSVGVQEIVDTAGVTKPTLYHHFGNKRGLLDAIISQYGSKLFEIIQRATTYHHDLVMNLTILTREYLAFALSEQSFFRFHLALLSAAPNNPTATAYQPLRSSINAEMERLFHEAAHDHGNMKGRERIYSENFQGILRTWALLVVNKEVELSDESLSRIVHFFMHGIFS
jgi:TetR/AcrR family transcriptional regulator